MCDNHILPIFFLPTTDLAVVNITFERNHFAHITFTSNSEDINRDCRTNKSESMKPKHWVTSSCKKKCSGYSPGKQTLKKNSYEKYEYEPLGSWYIKSTFCKRFAFRNTTFLKNKVVVKLGSLWYAHFVLPILFLLAVSRAVFLWNFPFSTVTFITKNQYSSFLKKVFLFQKICFEGKV